MALKKEDFKSRLGKRLYDIIFDGKKDKDPLKEELISIIENTHYKQEEQPGNNAKGYSALDSSPKPPIKKRNKDKEISDIVQPESIPETQEPAVQATETKPKQKIPPADYAPKKEEKPAEYRMPTRRETLQMCEQMGVIGEKVTLLKLISNICIKKSTLVEGSSNAGKSWVLDHVFELVPDSMKCKTNDSRNFFDLAKRYNGQFPFIVMGELQTFLRGSKNEKDILRCIGNGEVYNFPLEDGKNLPISAWGVYASIADSNRYKKMLVDGDKELLRRFHRVYIELTDEKMKQRLEAIAKQQMPTYSSASEKDADLDTIKSHIEKTINLEISPKRFFNPFARFMIEYIGESCKGAGKMEEAAKIATYHKNYVIAGTKWNVKFRKFGKGNDFRFIASIGDAYIAKTLTDSELTGEKKSIDWHACWESGIESLKASGYPDTIIKAYIQRQVSDDNKLYMNDPITGTQVTLADLSRPKPAHIVVTQENYEILPEDQTIDAKVAGIAPEKPIEPEILDAEYKVIESGELKELPYNIAGYLPLLLPKDPETSGLSDKPNLPVLYNSNCPAARAGRSAEAHSREFERKQITCQNE